MRIYNATSASMNLPLPNGSRLLIGKKQMSRQFYPTVELLNLLVSAYSRDDIAILLESSGEVSMGAIISALPGYVAANEEEAVMRFQKKDEKVEAVSTPAATKPAEKAKEVKEVKETKETKTEAIPTTTTATVAVKEAVKENKTEKKEK
jgi:outer membrane biosynthesis protein TonB